MPESFASLIREVAELKEGSARLADQVESLSRALGVMNDLQQRQKLTQAKVEVVAENAATKQELRTETAERELVRAEARTRFRWTLALSIVSILLGVGFGFEHEQGRRDSYQTCSARSAQNAKVSAYLNGLQGQALAQARTDAERARIQTQLDVLKDAFHPVSCDRFKGWF